MRFMSPVGPNELGSYRNIKLTKLDGESRQLDLYKLLLGESH